MLYAVLTSGMRIYSRREHPGKWMLHKYSIINVKHSYCLMETRGQTDHYIYEK